MATKQQATLTAAEEMAALDAAEAGLRDRRDELQAAISAAAERRGVEILDGTLAGQAPAPPDPAVLSAMAELADVEAALVAAASRRPGLARKAKEEEIVSLMAEAERLNAEAAEREKVTKEMLDQLFEHEGVRYCPPELAAPSKRLTRSLEMRQRAKAMIVRAKKIEAELR